ncbi:MAG: hypothetical protein HY344_01215 [Candidatus Levybacteria bacterium]|nr:hypothetical protein [Candidatus Levybacteria bacterium]
MLGEYRPATIPRPEILRRVDLEDRLAKRVFITGAYMQTPFGGLRSTLDARLRGESAVVSFPDTGIDDVSVAAPLNFNAREHLDLGREDKWYSELAVLELYVITQALGSASMLDENGRLDVTRLNAYKGGLFGNSGIGQALGLVDIHDMIKLNNDLRRQLASGEIDRATFLERRAVIKGSDAFRAFPDQGNSRTAEYHKLMGKGNYASQACASGQAAVVDAYESIKSGKNRWAIAGGIERSLTHPELSFASFDILHSLSHNPDPQSASRPLDRNRDGFIIGEGAGYLILESEDQALERGATILAEITGGENVMDGFKKTEANPDRIAMAIGKTCEVGAEEATEETPEGDIVFPDVAYLHLTSTELGDRVEIEAIRKVWGEYTRYIPLVGNKSAFGHALGAAGAINTIEAVYGIIDGVVAPTIHLRERGEEFEDLDVVETARRINPQTALVTANGFGGWTSALLLKKFDPAA